MSVQPYGAILGMSVAEDVFPGVWPMSGVVASALMATPVVRHAVNILGVREAGTRSIMKMFADGFRVNTMLGHVSGEGRGRYSIASYVREAHRQSLDVTPKFIHVVFVVCEACSFHSRHTRQP